MSPLLTPLTLTIGVTDRLGTVTGETTLRAVGLDIKVFKIYCVWALEQVEDNTVVVESTLVFVNFDFA